jgi:hypothetical protein
MTSFGEDCMDLKFLKLLPTHQLYELGNNVNREKQRREQQSVDEMKTFGLSRFHAMWPQLEKESGKVEVEMWTNNHNSFDAWFSFTPMVKILDDEGWNPPYKLRLAKRKDTGRITVHFDLNQARFNFVLLANDHTISLDQSHILNVFARIPMFRDMLDDPDKVITKLSAI